MMIPAGSGNTERHIAMIEDYGTTVLVATPSYALHVCEVGEKMGYDWAKSPLRVGLFGGEPCPPGLKAEIESRMLAHTPIHRLGEPSDIAGAVLYFAAPVSEWVSGQVLFVNGGGVQTLD